MTTFTPGSQFGRYRISRLLGQGGMADVYEAEDTQIGRTVALKVLPPAFARDEERASRFQKEIRACGTLDHPGIVSVFDVGDHEGTHFYTMALLPGGDLKSRLTKGALAPIEALRRLRELADSLDYAHSKGFVHRDVKPENILFRENDSAVLTDFGIARAMGSGTRMTATGLSIGTPHYMSPEQARGQAVDGRSDLYALGVVFYEMLTGKVPFDAQDSFAVGLMHINDPIPQLGPTLAKYQPLLDRLLAKDPADRYQTGAELIEDLERIEQGEKLKPVRSATRVVKKMDRGSRIADRGEGTEKDSRPGLYWGLGGAALAAVLAVGLYFWQDQRSSTPPIGGGATTVSRPAPQPIETIDTERATPETGTRKPEPVPTGTAILHITTSPEGAEVFLNDTPLGTTPFQSDELPEGEHRLRLVHRYYEPWEQTLRLEDDVVERIEAELQRGTGRVTVVTDPPGAEVWIDGSPSDGTTPLTMSGLTSGDQSLEIRLARYRTEIHEVEILPGETARLDLSLEGGDLHEWEGRWLTGDEVIPFLLEAAEADLSATRLMQPEDDNAWEKYQRVLAIQPGHESAQQGIARIAERYVELAEDALNDNQLDRAENFLANAATAGADGSDYERLEGRLQTALDERRAEQQYRQLVTNIQRELARLGRDISPDGSLGTSTEEAIRAFERGTNRSESGEASDQLLAALRSADRWPAPQPGDTFQDCPDCPEMVVIPAGRFTMGSPSNEPQRRDNEGPQRQVNVPAFAVGKYAVTFAQWDACVAEGGCSHQPGDRGWGRGTRPVINVNWTDAQEYVDWLSEKTGEDYRLASEAEWEYTARAGTTTRFNTGHCITTSQSNFDGNHPAQGCPRGEHRQRTVPVGSFSPNAFGLYEMHGNVWEWVQDCWNRSYHDAPTDGSAWARGDCDRAIVRGGSYNFYGRSVRSAVRNSWTRGNRFTNGGFRVARSLLL